MHNYMVSGAGQTQQEVSAAAVQSESVVKKTVLQRTKGGILKRTQTFVTNSLGGSCTRVLPLPSLAHPS